MWYHEVKSERETSASSASPFWVLISDVHCFVVSRSSGHPWRVPKRTKQLAGVDLENRIRLKREFPVSKLAKRGTASLCVRVRVRVRAPVRACRRWWATGWRRRWTRAPRRSCTSSTATTPPSPSSARSSARSGGPHPALFCWSCHRHFVIALCCRPRPQGRARDKVVHPPAERHYCCSERRWYCHHHHFIITLYCGGTRVQDEAARLGAGRCNTTRAWCGVCVCLINV